MRMITEYLSPLQRSLEYYKTSGGTPPVAYKDRMLENPNAPLVQLLSDEELLGILNARTAQINRKTAELVGCRDDHRSELMQRTLDFLVCNQKDDLAFLREIGRLPEEFNQEGVEHGRMSK